jgi:hypothetical protein
MVSYLHKLIYRAEANIRIRSIAPAIWLVNVSSRFFPSGDNGPAVLVIRFFLFNLNSCILILLGRLKDSFLWMS